MTNQHLQWKQLLKSDGQMTHMLVLEKKNNVAIDSFENNKNETRHTKPLYIINKNETRHTKPLYIINGIVGH